MAISPPTSEVEICNLALDHLKQAPIADIDPPSSGPEEVCARWYSQERRATLRMHVWNFAKKTKALTPDPASDPEIRYSHAYNLPNDFIRLVKVWTEDGIRIEPGEYEIENGQLLYDGEDNTEIHIEYIFDQTSVTKFDPLFIKLFALNLAISIAPKFSGTEARANALKEERKDVDAQARAIDGQEKPPIRRERSKWKDSRRFGRKTGGETSASPYTIFD